MSDIETRVRDAIAMNVDFMDGSPELVERAITAAGNARRRRRGRRAMAGALVVTAGVGALVGVAVANHGDRAGVTVSAGESTSTPTSPSTVAATVPPPSTLPSPSALVAQWNARCGTAPHLAPVPGLRFTIQLASRVMTPGGSTTAGLVFENTTAHPIRVFTGVGAWFLTTPSGRLVSTSLGYPVFDIGYGFEVAAHRWVVPREPSGFIGASEGACTTAGGLGPDLTPPLPRGHYLAWFGIPDTKQGMFISDPAPIEVGGAPLWNVKVTRVQALARGRADAYDPDTSFMQAKLASWSEIHDAGSNVGTSPADNPDRRVWVVSIMGNVHRGMCCVSPQPPFRWGVVYVDASTGEPFAFGAGRSGRSAPWFAALPDHGA